MTREQGRMKAGGTQPVESGRPGAAAVKVACVGDSITRGTFVWRRKKRSYPAQLQRILGAGFCVRNFGVNGHAVQRAADRSYRDSEAFEQSSTFEPDIVLIMLGTNDSRGDNWKGLGPFVTDYRALTMHYRSLESHPQVWLLTPPALFRLGRSEKVRYAMDEGAINDMCVAIKDLASELGCGLIDVNSATARHPEAFRLDGVHPGGAGATLIAQAVNEALSSVVARTNKRPEGARMKPGPLEPGESSSAKSHSLGRVLGRSREIKVAIKKAAGRLTSATAALKQGKRAQGPAHSVEQVIAQYENVEGEVIQAAHDLSQVNTALAVEVEERVGIESELADTKADLADMKVDLAAAHEDLSVSQASEDEALQRALHDPLTGLPNRALFDQGLAQGLIQARRHGWGLAVLFMDVDDFKTINDSYGHHVGDEVLIMIADRLRSFVRAEDMVSRWGGDEFVCLLLEVGEHAELTRLAHSMIERIAEEFESAKTTLSIGCSVGIAIYPGDGESADVLLRNADEAMYRAKGAADRVVLFGAQPPAGGNTQVVR